jgi:hypothetical protein
MFVNDGSADSHRALDDAIGPDDYAVAQLGIAVNTAVGCILTIRKIIGMSPLRVKSGFS